ncbi:MAG: hypothetical protein ACI87C_001785, partial [Paraperlucidibaca sp.]
MSFFSLFQMASFIRHSAGGALNKTSHLKKTLFSTISPDGFRHHPGNPQPATRNPQPATRNPQPATRNPQPATRNPQPATRV